MNDFEYKVAEKLRAAGWELLHNGWPDFLCWRDVEGKREVMCVELKNPQTNDALSSTQITNHAVLLSAGLPVHTVSTPKIGKLHVATSIVVLADDARLRLERQQQSFSNALDALRRTVEKDIHKVEEKHKEKFTMHQNTLAAIEHAARKIGA